jgi:hypothetical protein
MCDDEMNPGPGPRHLVQIQGLLHNNQENINGDGNPDLSFDCIFNNTIKILDSEMLLDPFEKQLDLPATV